MANNRSIDIPNNTPTYKSWQSSDGANWTIERNWTWHNPYEWILNVGEVFSCKEQSIVTDVDLSLQDAFVVADKRPVFEYSSALSDRLKIVDKVQFAASFICNVAENVRIACHHANTVELPFNSSFGMFDALTRSAQGVVSDLLFENGEWTMDSLRNAMLKGKHVGYDNFRPFIYGDYTYDSALFRTVLEATSEDRAVLEQFQITVDVPDMVDRGSAEVEDKNFDLQVEFNKNFHIAPEVTITMRAGTSAEPVVPEVVETTETYFKVHLINAITGEKTTGRFIWSAVGY